MTPPWGDGLCKYINEEWSLIKCTIRYMNIYYFILFFNFFPKIVSNKVTKFGQKFVWSWTKVRDIGKWISHLAFALSPSLKQKTKKKTNMWLDK